MVCLVQALEKGCMHAYRQKTHFSYILLGYCVQLGRFCPQEQHRVTQQLGKLHQSNTGVPQKQFQQVCLLDVMYVQVLYLQNPL